MGVRRGRRDDWTTTPATVDVLAVWELSLRFDRLLAERVAALLPASVRSHYIVELLGDRYDDDWNRLLYVRGAQLIDAEFS